jgi:hypothetical protein
LSTVFFVCFFLRIRALQDKAMQRQTSTNQRDEPGQNTGRAQGYLSSDLRGGAPGERHRAKCETDSRGCDTHCGGLDERPTQNLRTGQETHRATVGIPGQRGNARMREGMRHTCCSVHNVYTLCTLHVHPLLQFVELHPAAGVWQTSMAIQCSLHYNLVNSLGCRPTRRTLSLV